MKYCRSTASDMFTGTGNLSGNWTEQLYDGGSANTIQRSSGVAVNSRGGWTGAFWNANSFNAEQYVIAKMSELHSSQINVRCSGGPTANQTNAYIYYYNVNGSDRGFQKIINGAYTNLAQVNYEFAAGEYMKLTITIESGNHYLRIYSSSDRITWTERGSYNLGASPELTSGAPGISLAFSGKLDDWEGGDIVDGPPYTDNFSRPDGTLGQNWTTMSGTVTPTIASNAVYPPSNAICVAYRNEAFSDDQYVQSKMPNTPGAATGPGIGVRFTSSGHGYFLFVNQTGGYVEIYRQDTASSITRLGGQVTPPSSIQTTDVWKFEAQGYGLFGYQNGVLIISRYDTTYPTGGAPGVWLYYTTQPIDDFEAGNAAFGVHYVSTDGNGVKTYAMTSRYNGGSNYVYEGMRILEPTTINGSTVALYVLPVEGGLESTWGNGLDQLRLLNAHNVYNAILISPQFDKDPWYCDHPTDLGMRHETFMCTDLRAWIQATYTPAKHHIIGFSKSGTGPMTMILRNPTLFDKISTWDSPFDMDSYSDFGGSSENAYGTEANFQNNYQLTAAHLESWKTAFLATNRLWISGFHVFQQDTIDFDSALTGKAMLHTFFTQIDRTHAWDSGWLPDALTGLFGAGGGSTIPLGTQRLLPQFSRM